MLLIKNTQIRCTSCMCELPRAKITGSRSVSRIAAASPTILRKLFLKDIQRSRPGLVVFDKNWREGFDRVDPLLTRISYGRAVCCDASH